MASSAGYLASRPTLDVDGVDWLVPHPGTLGFVRSPKIEVQVKTWSTFAGMTDVAVPHCHRRDQGRMMGTMQRDELAEIDLSEEKIDAMMAEGEPIEVTGPFDPVRRVRFELVAGGLQPYRWRLAAAHGEILATSAARYQGRAVGRRAVATLSTALREAPTIDVDNLDEPANQRIAS